MKKRKSQITIFMIIALVLFVIIGFLFYLTKYSTKKQTGEETTTTQRTPTDLQPIENYVKQCLEKTAKEGIVLLGKQGGYLYKSQGGPLIDYRGSYEGLFFVNYNGYKVSYGIYPLRFNTGPYYSKAPDYPWPEFPYMGGVKTLEGQFGMSNLPPLNGSFGSVHPIEEVLEYYITNNIKNCIDWGVFEKQGYEITESNFSVDLRTTKEEVSVHLIYPLTIKKTTTDSTTMQDFLINLKIRFKKTYDIVSSLIENDITNMTFDIENDAFLGEGFSVHVIRNAFKQEDIIIVGDENSLINNVPYEFIFARSNRLPALEEITSPIDIEDCDNLVAHDPDEDSLTFTCAGSTVTVSDGILEDYQDDVTINIEK
jgi:hypothetical protein